MLRLIILNCALLFHSPPPSPCPALPVPARPFLFCHATPRAYLTPRARIAHLTRTHPRTHLAQSLDEMKLDQMVASADLTDVALEAAQQEAGGVLAAAAARTVGGVARNRRTF